MNRGRDACVSLRKTYNAFLRLIITWNWLACIVAGTPMIYLLGFLIYNSVYTSLMANMLSTSGYSGFGILLATWVIAVISILRNMPNLLTIAIFVYSCLGHWSLISLLILIFYGLGNHLPGYILMYLCAILIPSILLLLISGDLMRAKRLLMFRALEQDVLEPKELTEPMQEAVLEAVTVAQ